MQALFYIPKDDNVDKRWDAQSMRIGGIGLSGTHQSYVIVAEELKRRAIVSHAYMFNFCNDVVVNDVEYISNLNKAFDAELLVIPSFITNMDFMFTDNKLLFSNLKQVVVWFHWHFLFTGLANSLVNLKQKYAHIKIDFVHISRWSQQHVLKMTPPVINNLISKQGIISNAVMSDMLNTPDYYSQKRSNDIIFIAGFDRGGEMAKRVWQKLKSRNPQYWGSFISKAYHIPGGCTDKKGIFELLSKAKYFIYPLVLPPEQYPYKIHRDTFACCVAEAIACGVEVLTYDVAALSEYYSGLVHFIDFPDGVTRHAINDSMADPYFWQMYHDNQVDIIANMLEQIDATYENRHFWRLQNAKQIRDKFSAFTVGDAWESFLSTSSSHVQSTYFNKRKPNCIL